MPAQLKAIGVPFKLDETGYPAPSFGNKVLYDSIRSIILTVPGERVMRPDFGCWAKLFLFDNLNQATATRVAFEIKRALEDWEPRIEVLDVSLAFDTKTATIGIEISWRASDQKERLSTVSIKGSI